MRPLLILTLLVLASGAARADFFLWHSKKKPAAVKSAGPPQDKKLEERLTRPDMGMEYNLENSTFGGSDRKSPTKAASVKSFDAAKSFESKGFSTKSFADTKSSSLTDKKYAVSDASVKGKYEIPNIGKKQDLKTVPMTTARDSTKVVAVNSSRESTQTFFGRGRSQDRFDKEKGTPEEKGLKPVGYTGDLKPMSIDDVRELLNKSK